MLHWDKDKPVCKLEITNENLKIRTKKIVADNIDTKDFKLHIDELLKLKLIQRSTSEHRSAAFIVRNHSEIVRGKSRMVINYKKVKL